MISRQLGPPVSTTIMLSDKSFPTEMHVQVVSGMGVEVQVGLRKA
jgi:hypothetical protein